jgi:hypothetical protein
MKLEKPWCQVNHAFEQDVQREIVYLNLGRLGIVSNEVVNLPREKREFAANASNYCGKDDRPESVGLRKAGSDSEKKAQRSKNAKAGL